MTHLSEEAKLAIVKKVLDNNGRNMAEIALTHNVGYSSLGKWLKKYKSDAHNPINQSIVNDTSPPLPVRFKHLLSTAGHESDIVGAYCRKNGLYPHQLKQWEADFMTPPNNEKIPKINAELKQLRAENKKLNQIIKRKDKVLAETVALLVLKKKADDIWGEKEED